MGIIDRLRDHAQRTARSVFHLPVLASRVTADPRYERTAAQAGLVPQRCGLCRHFSRQAFEEELQANAEFREAIGVLSPSRIGKTRADTSGVPVSDAARALRPTLTHRWEDYGGCTKYSLGVWAFAEQPPMPGLDSPPCEAWT